MILGFYCEWSFGSNVLHVLCLIGLSAISCTPPPWWCLTVAIIASLFILCDWGGLRGDRLGLKLCTAFCPGTVCFQVCVLLPALYNKTVKLNSCLVLCISEGSEPRENIKVAVTTHTHTQTHTHGHTHTQTHTHGHTPHQH